MGLTFYALNNKCVWMSTKMIVIKSNNTVALAAWAKNDLF